MNKTPMRLRHLHHLPVSLDSPIVVVAGDWVAQSFNSVILDHRVALDDDPDSTFAPTPVEVNEFGRWDAAAGNILVAPVAEAFSHGGFKEAVACCTAGEWEGDRLAEQCGVYIAGAFDARMAASVIVLPGGLGGGIGVELVALSYSIVAVRPFTEST
jgi:hypothetical protein